MRRWPFSLLLLLVCVGDYAGPGARPMLGRDTRVTATAIPLNPDDPAQVRVGALRYVQGWRLRGRDRAFGGFSAMAVNGDRFRFISDAGGVVDFRLGAGGAVSQVRFGDLKDGPGRGYEKRDRDSEAFVFDPVSGKSWVAFERWNEIWRYGPDLLAGEASARPGAMLDWPDNSGAEAMVRLRSGAFLVFSEGGRGPRGSTAALLFPGDPTVDRRPPVLFGYQRPAGYRITDAAELPDGRLVALYRRFGFPDGFSAKLAILDPRAIRHGAVLTEGEIATLARPLNVDNFEAIAVTRESGRTLLWIASDDNLNGIQRSLLMQFALD
ncbi:MAG: hypothetical protein ABS87_07895 [Sphingomonas sp. SCN 67-18]|uniref:esterase-like activity of phytase family protein n=1 Tax=uncultured Sphingomonas sp. TaxID=158754 RepID=UPI00086D0953|nr:esterase-like activity of phytase family protein [Sphingomonas sp. SCN 67-18]ODU21110.1 MAG: hypothetical protein ABS87_07895 [Sphingomonas sp. SCN 67-18]